MTAHDHAVAKLVLYADSKSINIQAPQVTVGRLRALPGFTPLKPGDPLAGLLEDRPRLEGVLDDARRAALGRQLQTIRAAVDLALITEAVLERAGGVSHHHWNAGCDSLGNGHDRPATGAG